MNKYEVWVLKFRIKTYHPAFLFISIWHQQRSSKSASKERVTVILPAQALCRKTMCYVIGPLWLCYIMSLLWLWALWQFVQLELLCRCLVVDFCLTERNLDSERQRGRKRDGMHRRLSCRILATLYPSTHTHNKFTPFPGCFTVIYTYTRTHSSLFFWLQQTLRPSLIQKKTTILAVMLPWVHTSLQNWWLSDCCSVFLSGLSTCLHAWLLLCLSVCRSAYRSHKICVITVCQLAYNTCMSANLSACPPLCLCASLHSQFTGLPGCLSCILPSCWRIISGGYFMKTWGGVSVSGRARRWQHE